MSHIHRSIDSWLEGYIRTKSFILHRKLYPSRRIDTYTDRYRYKQQAEDRGRGRCVRPPIRSRHCWRCRIDRSSVLGLGLVGAARSVCSCTGVCVRACVYITHDGWIDRQTDRFKHTCIQAYMQTCIHTYIHTYIHACMHTYIQTCMHTYMHAYMHKLIHHT